MEQVMIRTIALLVEGFLSFWIIEYYTRILDLTRIQLSKSSSQTITLLLFLLHSLSLIYKCYLLFRISSNILLLSFVIHICATLFIQKPAAKFNNPVLMIPWYYIRHAFTCLVPLISASSKIFVATILLGARAWYSSSESLTSDYHTTIIDCQRLVARWNYCTGNK